MESVVPSSRLRMGRQLQQSADSLPPGPLAFTPDTSPATSVASEPAAVDVQLQETSAGSAAEDSQAAAVTVPGSASAPTEAESPAAGGVDPKKVVIVNSGREFALALSRNEQHIELRSHFVFNPYETYDEVYEVETRQPAEKDGWQWHTDPNTSNIRAHMQVGAPVRSIRVCLAQCLHCIYSPEARVLLHLPTALPNGAIFTVSAAKIIMFMNLFLCTAFSRLLRVADCTGWSTQEIRDADSLCTCRRVAAHSSDSMHGHVTVCVCVCMCALVTK